MTDLIGRLDARSSLRGAMVGVFLLALVVRVLFIVVVPGPSLRVGQLRGDEIDYHQIATSLQDGDGFARPWPGAGPNAGHITPTAFRTPLWPMALAAVYAVAGPEPAAGRVLVVLLSALTAALLVPLGRRLWSPAAGVVAGVIGAVFPPMWMSSWRLMSEPLFTTLVLLALLAAERFRRDPNDANAALLGGALGLAALARPNGLVIGAALIGWLLITQWQSGVRRAVRTAAICGVATVVVIAPWTIRNAVQMHSFIPLSTQGGAVIAGYYSPTLLDRSTPYWGGWDFPLVIQEGLRHADNEVSWDKGLQHQGRAWIEAHPGDAATIVGYHVLRYFDLYLDIPQRRTAFEGMPSPWTTVNIVYLPSVWLAFALGVVGLVRVRRAGSLNVFAPALFAYAALALSGILLGAGPRFREPSEPILVLLVAIALIGPFSSRSAPLEPEEEAMATAAS